VLNLKRSARFQEPAVLGATKLGAWSLERAAIDLTHVSCAYDREPVLSGVSLAVPEGHFVG